ncbi:hypothetical protein [Pseudoclavibacter sp. RFBB5]|uniref:hypothetical protein n=1 Tax=Pseudoclavibacter sp. RFBB5 TaxID=2080574 RepID=UPI0011B047AA|nr:hypothetical protein [Pseudoclavibacter sp. RFBB5]
MTVSGLAVTMTARRREGAYRVYLAVAVGLIAVAPIVRMLFLALLQPASIGWLTSADFLEQLRLLTAAVGPVGMLVGTVRGPALLAPFATVTLGSNHLPRMLTLRRPFVKSLIVAAAVSAAVVCLPGAALVVGLGARPLAVVACAVAAVAVASLGVVSALLGQLLVGPRVWAGALLLGVWGASPLGDGQWFAASWAGLVGDADAGIIGTVLLVAAAVVALAAVPGLLNRLRGDALLLQAGRRESASVAIATGELAGAAATYRERPTTGRRLSAVVGGPRVLRMLVRDAVGAMRTPQRTVLGILGLAVGAVLLGSATGHSGAPELAGAAASTGAIAGIAAVASVLMYLALGTFADGFRHAADAAVGAAVFGTPVGEQFLLHAVFPVALVVLVVGAVVAVSGGGPVPLLVALALVAVRAFDAARGHLPPLLLTPMPSEVGDLSVIARLAWQFDGVLLSVALGLGLALPSLAGAPALSIATLAVATPLLALATTTRLRQGRG